MEFSYRRWPLFKGIVFLSIVYFCLVAVFLNAVALLLFDVHVIPHFAEFSFAKNMFGGLLGLGAAIVLSRHFFYMIRAFIKKEPALTLEGDILTIHFLHNCKINVHDILFLNISDGPSLKKDRYMAKCCLREEGFINDPPYLNSFLFEFGTIKTLRKIKCLTGAKFKINCSPIRKQWPCTRYFFPPGHY